MNQNILTAINGASEIIGTTWPLYTFVASNPLSGYENKPFEEAVALAEKYLQANTFPKATVYQQAYDTGLIDDAILTTLLKKNGFTKTPEFYLNQLSEKKEVLEVNLSHDVDRIMTKWLSAFLDEGLAEWTMPFKEKGFFTAWRALAPYDTDLNDVFKKEIPETACEVIDHILQEIPSADYELIFKYHLAALPGWIGYIKYRTNAKSDWEQKYPLALLDYLAVRLWICKNLGHTIVPDFADEGFMNESVSMQHLWLQAWEKSYQKELSEKLTTQAKNIALHTTDGVKEAQFVFCIDTRSEVIRRHVESKGNYETFGYAGFFGIAMDYKSLQDDNTRKSCPPIVSSVYTVTEEAQENKAHEYNTLGKRIKVLNFSKYLFKRMKNILPSAFGYVEGSGLVYGLGMVAKTLFPSKLLKIRQRTALHHEASCQPVLQKNTIEATYELDIPLVEKVGIVKSAFDLLGWTQFAPIVVFVGHGSLTTNNPFSSSLDCGACAASPGRHNARMLASLANLPEVKERLNVDHGILIPEGTIFLGAEHNTTTDCIAIFDAQAPDSHVHLIRKIKLNLMEAQKTATQDRLGISAKSIALAERKAADWGETRPEWGLAKNASFVIAPRNLTKHINLDARSFLHSYDWKLDTSGKALEGIMQGPMVVTQWINNHYYFSTIDNNIFGGGTKITHNVTGKFGVVQGNGGDLKMGLPLQSLFATDDEMYHQPLRLSVVIQAPISRVKSILDRNEKLKSLLDNKWIYLMVMDPIQEDKIFTYEQSQKWSGDAIKNSSEEQLLEKLALEVAL
ncbi:DUF2309 domain-containing protein [Cellulophaga baltica]|uniref:Probable inorganic carbon transporter subunit DabA n=1 Tax=Cellulophaga baltica TaxID=76594 RepID=A0A1G7KUV7_9FLAO|nr:DUF2309 domain-containing protein [Cellulophaga baltica]SDF40710.1 hypothetical protein SAMN04487992_11412 [Cellulophaga baltica]